MSRRHFSSVWRVTVGFWVQERETQKRERVGSELLMWRLHPVQPMLISARLAGFGSKHKSWDFRSHQNAKQTHKKQVCVLLRDDKPIWKQGELPAACTLFPPFFLRYSRVCMREARGRRLCHRLYNVTVLRAGADAGQSHQSRRSKPQH